MTVVYGEHEKEVLTVQQKHSFYFIVFVLYFI